jgi:predicted SprT family Zn-dependent metalloprotease
VSQLEFIFSKINDAVLPQTAEASEEASSEDATTKKDQSDVLVGHDRKLTEQCALLLRNLGLSSVAKKIAVVWNPRMRTTAGRAFWPDAKIEMNPKLREIAPGEVAGTLLHELAHVVAFARAGRRRIKAHGAEWQQACADLGIPGETATHSLPLPGRKMKRRWRYTCPACGKGFDRVRPMRRLAACYACCLEHNGGYYHVKYRLVEHALK